jgi:hypothetical protein
MAIMGRKIRGGSAGYPQAATPRKIMGGGSPVNPAATARTYEKDAQGLNKMPDVKSLGQPLSGATYHSTQKGSNSPLRHEVSSYGGGMHTVNTYGQTAKGEQRIGSYMTDQSPSYKDGNFSFGGGNTFDMGTGKQAPSGAFHQNSKLTREWKN